MKKILFFLSILFIASVCYAATKITDLNENSTLATNDVFPHVDVSDTSQASSGSTKKVTLTNILTDANIPNTITIDSATALTANGANCSAGSAPLGVDASGASETCTDYEEDLSNSAGLAAALSDETGSGLAVFQTSPTLVTPALGTIASGVGTSLTALNGENIQDDTIDDDSLDFGTSTDQISASDMPNEDLGDISISGGVYSVDGNSVALSTDTTGNYVLDVADGTGVDGTASGEGATYTPSLDFTEISSLTWGAGSFTTMTFDAGATDPILTASSGFLTQTTGTFAVDNANGIRFYETDANGSNFQAIRSTDSLSADATFKLNITASTCTSDGNAGALTVNSSNEIVCSADDGGAGGSGDVTDVGDCSGGACNDGTSDGGTYIRLYDGDSHYAEFEDLNLSANRTLSAPDATGTLVLDTATQTLTNKTLAASNNVIEADTGDSATSFFSAGTIEHERGGLEADISAYDGLIGITGGATYNQTGTTTQIIIFDGSGAPTSAALSGDTTMTNGGVVTIAANAVALTTDTTGNYLADGAGTTEEVNVSGGGSEGATLTIGLPDNIEIDGTLAVQGTVSIMEGKGFRLHEASANGTNYIGFLPPSSITTSFNCTLENDSTPIPDSCVGDGTDGGGTSVWTDADPVLLGTTTRDVVIGATQIVSAKLSIDGDADQVQFAVQSNATQTGTLMLLENSSGANLLSVSPTGSLLVGGGTSAGALSVKNASATELLKIESDGSAVISGDGSQSTITEGLIINNGDGTDTDDDFQVKGTGTSDLFYDVSAGSLGVGTSTPTSGVELDVAGDVQVSGTILFTNTSSVGWTAVDGTDNVACNTTCTRGCIFGVQNATGTAVTGIVSCNDATADTCFCGGGS